MGLRPGYLRAALLYYHYDDSNHNNNNDDGGRPFTLHPSHQ
jgi:hypothetical protein